MPREYRYEYKVASAVYNIYLSLSEKREEALAEGSQGHAPGKRARVQCAQVGITQSACALVRGEGRSLRGEKAGTAGDRKEACKLPPLSVPHSFFPSLSLSLSLVLWIFRARRGPGFPQVRCALYDPQRGARRLGPVRRRLSLRSGTPRTGIES